MRTPMEMIQEMLDSAMKLRREETVITKIGTAETVDGPVPFTIAVACGPGAIALRRVLERNSEADPRGILPPPKHSEHG